MVERYQSALAAEPPKKNPKGFQPGNDLGKGRPKGIPNRTSKMLKDAISGAGEQLGMMEPIYAYTGSGRDRRKTDRIIGWKPTGRGGTQGYLVWLGANHPNAFATLLGRLLPLQINATATMEMTVSQKFSEVDISKMSLPDKLSAFREAIGLTKALPPPDKNTSGMIEGEFTSVPDGDSE